MTGENLSEAEAEERAYAEYCDAKHEIGEEPFPIEEWREIEHAAAEEFRNLHTAEPWKARTLTGEQPGMRVYAGRNEIATCHYGSPEVDHAEAQSNAARIVACVNALAGVKDPAGLVRRLRAELSATADHLRKALEKVAGSDGVMLKADQWAAREQIKRAEATLREAEGA